MSVITIQLSIFRRFYPDYRGGYRVRCISLGWFQLSDFVRRTIEKVMIRHAQKPDGK